MPLNLLGKSGILGKSGMVVTASGGGGSTVALDANGTAPVNAAGVITMDFLNLTVGTGANRALIVQIAWAGILHSGMSVIWDPGFANQACSLINSATASDNSSAVELWGLVAPVSGNKVLRIDWTGSGENIVNATSFTGVDQTGGVTSFPNSTSANGTSTTPSVTISSAPGRMTVDLTNVATQVHATSPSQTAIFGLDGGGSVNAAASRAAGAASNTHSWTITSAPWVSVGTDIKAAP